MADQFDKAAEYIRNAPEDVKPKLTQEVLLKLYALFKQGTNGDCTADQPWAVQVEARAKHDAWSALKGKSQDDAKAEYVALVKELAPAF